MAFLFAESAWASPQGEQTQKTATGSVRFASTWTGDTAALQTVVANFTKETGIPVKINQVDGPTFSGQINSYLQATPDDIFTWFGGYRMRYYAQQGLLASVNDVWSQVGSNFSQGYRKASTGNDGKQYLIPFYSYPWVILYRQSVFKEHGYAIPKTLSDLKVLAKKMQNDGLVPFAFADQDGWPAMGWFDILDMRLNGGEFHTRLLAGKEKWTDPRVANVFKTWKQFLPYYGSLSAALGRTWQNGANLLINKQAGMLFFGTFAGTQATKPADHNDLNFFAFPTLGTKFDSEMGIDAPINGFCVASKSPTLKANKAAVTKFATYLASAKAQSVFLKQDPNFVAANSKVDTSQYVRLQRRSAEIIGKAGYIAQFLDRDSDPAFATQMQSFLQDWLANPNQDLTAFLGKIQAFWNSLGING